ncbi:MAG TPA: RIP metalloprotease RseP [Candidatus Dormibacteraeota bacterium]|nr:RIP metalloprotease RseP [Candidatus Dormibacteraeota bacterium]
MNTIIGMVLVLGVIILVHEWGHFIAARFFGVRVDVFSVGFGPRLFGIKRGATDWRVSALPLGGYVRMAGQDISDIDSGEEAPKGLPDELMSKKRWQRAVISFAGPAVNLIFPIVLFGGYYAIAGVPYAAFERKPVVVNEFSTAHSKAVNGLEAGDKVVSLNGTKNPNWEQALKIVGATNPGGALSVEVENGGAARHLDVPVTNDPRARVFGYMPILPAIGEVAAGTPASHAGLQAGDVIRSVDGQKIEYWDQFVDQVRGSGGKTLQVEVSRKGQAVNLTITPKQGLSESTDKNYQIGVAPHVDFVHDRVGPVGAVQAATTNTAEYVAGTFAILGKLLTGRLSVKQLQSVVGISRSAGQAVAEGAETVISFMVLISVNLGILNLLPIPILDGGHILLLSMEGLRRRDFSLAFKERFIQVGLVFLLVILAYAMYNDVVRLLPSHS